MTRLKLDCPRGNPALALGDREYEWADEETDSSSIFTTSEIFSDIEDQSDSGRWSIALKDELREAQTNPRTSPATPQLKEDDKTPLAEREGEGQHTTPQATFPRISKPVELLRPSYACIVIGSGYGGGVAASRMARAGQSVCLLERGQEKWPGEYPVTVREAAQQFHVSGEVYSPDLAEGSSVERGDPTGMYHLVCGRDLNAMVGNGLGGTSLINANVFLEADESVLSMDFWPPEIRNDPGMMKKYYQAVKDVLEPKPYPQTWPRLKKMEVFERQAEALGLADRFHRVPQTTRFHSGPNSCGVTMSASTLTGQDAMGINDGSKTTTLVTYLADAWNWGAEIFCQCEVRYIEKAKDERGGYIVYFAWHGHNRERFDGGLQQDMFWVHARKAVFLGAGAIGTTEILLRSKAMGLEMSDCVGQGMSGNGDMLAFGYNVDTEVNAVGKPYPCPTNPVGPTITSMIDDRKGHENPLHGLVIQDGAIPQALSEFLHIMLELMPGKRSDPNKSLLGRAQDAMVGWKSRLLGPFGPNGGLEKTQVLLIMSHDGSQATLSLKNDKPVLEFLGVGRSDRVKELNGLLAKATAAVGGTLVHNPFYAAMGQQQICAHPLGGANMSWDNTGAHGATNHLGEVFVGNNTSKTHRGLIVTDGALIPASIGVNPFATIAALAERAVTEYARENKLIISTKKNQLLDLYGEPAHRPQSNQDERLETVDSLFHEAKILKFNRLDFVELMSGFIHFSTSPSKDEKSSYELASRIGESRGQSARFLVNVALMDPDMLLKEKGSTGILTGTFICPALEGSPFMVLRGGFDLFKRDHDETGTSRLTYDFDMVGVNGRRLHFHGYKIVQGSATLNPRQLWSSTTTLYVKITECAPLAPATSVQTVAHGGGSWRSRVFSRLNATSHSSGDQALQQSRNAVVARGILRLRPSDLLPELLTLTPTGSHLLEKAYKVANFVSLFAFKSASFVLGPLAPLEYPVQTYQSFVNYTMPSKSFNIAAEDGVHTVMHMWEPIGPIATNEQGSAVDIEDLFMIPGASVNQQIFSLPTIPFNAVNYFTRAGYRVFVSVHRICMLKSTSGQQWTTYDARLDIKACLERMRELQRRRKKIYTIAHCMGAVAFSCGLLDGTIPSDWILGISCSQVFMNPICNTLNMIKATMPVGLDKLYSLAIGDWLECSTSSNDVLVQQVLNQMLRFFPSERHEMCSNAACHRTTLLYGRCWSHHNLNEATHRNIDKFFGGASMRLMELLKRQGSRGEVSTNGPEFTELSSSACNIERLRGIPFFFFVGGDNAVLSPAATEKTYERLRDRFGISAGLPTRGVQYQRRVIPGYGHLDCWMGRNAWRDVFPFVREEVDRVVRGKSYRFQQPKDRFSVIIEAGEI